MNVYTQTDLAEHLGVTPDVIRQWRHRHPDFPQPAGYVGVAPYWTDLKPIQHWHEQRGEGVFVTPS